MFVTAQVTAVDGEPIADATVDVWHADTGGFYDLQDPNWNPDVMELRAVFKTDGHGRFRFRSIMPCAYPVPTDRPVGEMLRATNRNAMRLAHIHFRLSTSGYDTLITYVFVAGDEWLDAAASCHSAHRPATAVMVHVRPLRDETAGPLPYRNHHGARARPRTATAEGWTPCRWRLIL